MNTTIDDYGRTVTAVGASGSIERVKVEHPKLMSRLSSLYWEAMAYTPPGRYIHYAERMFEDVDIYDKKTRNLIITACDFPVEFWKF